MAPKNEIQAEGKPVELDFSVNAYFGSHDREESGDMPLAIIDKEGTIFELEKVSADWQEITAGVEINMICPIREMRGNP